MAKALLHACQFEDCQKLTIKVLQKNKWEFNLEKSSASRELPLLQTRLGQYKNQ